MTVVNRGERSRIRVVAGVAANTVIFEGAACCLALLALVIVLAIARGAPRNGIWQYWAGSNMRRYVSVRDGVVNFGTLSMLYPSDEDIGRTCCDMSAFDWRGFQADHSSATDDIESYFEFGRLAAFARVSIFAGPMLEHTVLSIRIWFLLVLASLWLLLAGRIAYRPVRRWRRRRRGLCVACGYDLRGNVASVCSECGDTRL